MNIIKKPFGVLSDGNEVSLYTLEAGDLRFSLTDFGATWTSLLMPSANSGTADVLLGFSSFAGYLHNVPYMGVTVGRVANRISGAGFSLNGKRYQLDRNDGRNTLHGGRRGFDKMLWKSEAYKEAGGVFVRFEVESPDGDGGFPGNVKAVVTYGLSSSNEIFASYHASSDRPTPINLTNHAYFNLAGEGKGNILSHEVRLEASSYLEIDQAYIPSGRILPVQGTPFDFRSRKSIKRDIKEEYGGSGKEGAPEGYDNCFVVDGEAGTLRLCAEVFEPESGRGLSLSTTQPGVQFYTGNMLTGIGGKAGSVYGKHDGFCLETQHFPDSPNQDGFPPCIVEPGKDYLGKAVFSMRIR
jgi:aldose 1-epimerase